MKNLYLTSLFIFLFLSIFSATAYADNITSIADSLVQNSSGSNYNYGVAQYLTVGRSGTTFENTYLRFNLSEISANITITNATVYVYMYQPPVSNSYVAAYNTSPYNTTGTVYWNEGTGLVTNCGSSCRLDQNITWNNKPAISVLQDNKTVGTTIGWVGFNVPSAAIAAAANTNGMLSIALIEGTNATNRMVFNSKEAASAKPYIEVSYTINDCTSSCGTCGCNNDYTGCNVPAIIGSYCDPLNSSQIITTTSECISTVSTCPATSICSQLSPQANTTSVYTDTVDCSACILITVPVGVINTHNITFSPNCRDLSQAYIDSCNCNEWYCSGHIYFGGASNTTFNIADYQAGCWDSTIQDWALIINSTGSNTTINEIVSDNCPNCTLTSASKILCMQTNTSNICYNKDCQLVQCPSTSTNAANSWVGIVAVGVGGLFGIHDATVAIWFFTLILIGSICALAAFYAKDSDTMPYLVIFAALCFLIAFTLANWLPAWVMIIIIVLSALLLAKKLGLGE